MKNITFNNIPDFNQNEVFQENVIKIQETTKQITDKFTESLSPTITKLKNIAEQSLVINMNDQLLILISEWAKAQISDSAIAFKETIITILDNQPVNIQSIIEFSEDDIQIAEELNIDLNEYSNESKTNNKKRVFTKKTIVELVGLLLALIALIQNYIYHLEDNKQSQETSQQIKELNESQRKTNELLETIISQMPTETSEFTENETLNQD